MDLQKRRELTAKAIELSPSEIVLSRRRQKPDGAGGWLPERILPFRLKPLESI